MNKENNNSSSRSFGIIRSHRAVISRLRMLRRYKGDPAKPGIMHVAITDKCNMSCPFCLYKGDNKNYKILDVDKARSLIKEIDSPVVLLSGGEPLLGGDILDATRKIAGICRELGRITCILTNGITLKQILEKDYPEFQPGSRFMFQISIDGLREDHNRLRGHFDLITDNIKFAKNAGHLIYTNTVISKDNVGSLDEIVKFVSGFSNRVYLNPMTSFNDNTLDQEDLKSLGDYIVDHQDIMIGNSINYGKFLRGDKRLKCKFHSVVSITPTGKIKFPCYCYGKGAEYVNSFAEYLERAYKQKDYFEHRMSPQCVNCHVHCLHESDVYAHFYLNELFEQIRRPLSLYRKYIRPLVHGI